MMLISTRDVNKKVTASEAIVQGISEDGGLFVPETLPEITPDEIKSLQKMNYIDRAVFVLSRLLPDFKEEDVRYCVENAYTGKFEEDDPAPLVKIDEGLFILELWHGPTNAFKDMALTMLPYLLNRAKKNLGIDEKTLILVATSGDTGKAALEGFKNVEGTEIAVFYPKDGVSEMQELQMVTTDGDNTHVIAIEGNFDDAQTAVKEIFNSKECSEKIKEEGMHFSSANSINWGRLVPQVAYYFSAYADLLESGEIKFGDKIDFCVPCGNFGNILAAHYARRMGLPVRKLICASNINNILTDFFRDGEYDVNRHFYKTMSPSMDILISSNLERLLFEISGRDAEIVRTRMDELKKRGVYKLTYQERKELEKEFYADFADEDETADTINNFFSEYDYPLDPHTAVAVAVYSEYDAEETVPTVIVSTASPYKFAADVVDAINGKLYDNAFKAAKALENLSALPMPESLKKLKDMPVLHRDVCSKDGAFQAVLKALKKK